MALLRSSQGWLVGLLRGKDGFPVARDDRVFVSYNETFGSMSASEQLRTYLPLPNLTLTPTCYQLTVVGLREG